MTVYVCMHILSYYFWSFITNFPSRQFRLVVKTALKLLLVFVEYSECNAPLLIEAIASVDTKRRTSTQEHLW